MKQPIVINIDNQIQFKQAVSVLLQLGYFFPKGGAPFNARSLFADDTGCIHQNLHQQLELSDDDKAIYKEVTFPELLEIAKVAGVEPPFNYAELIKIERPLFEANYVENGGDLQFLKWLETSDGLGGYAPDYDALQIDGGSLDIEEVFTIDEVSEHANDVQSRLMTWVECAKSKAIPKGYYVLPIQPTEEMLTAAKDEFQDIDIDDLDVLDDCIVFAHQAMIEAYNKSKK